LLGSTSAGAVLIAPKFVVRAPPGLVLLVFAYRRKRRDEAAPDLAPESSSGSAAPDLNGSGLDRPIHPHEVHPHEVRRLAEKAGILDRVMFLRSGHGPQACQVRPCHCRQNMVARDEGALKIIDKAGFTGRTVE